MTVYLFLILTFSDGTAPKHVSFIVSGGIESCIRLSAVLLRNPPPAVIASHVVDKWSVTCDVEKVSVSQ